jgi:pimeloyl-ACP methyl ester carboxylesterase
MTCFEGSGRLHKMPWGNISTRSLGRLAPGFALAVSTQTGYVRANVTVLNMSTSFFRACWLFPLLLMASCETTAPVSTVTSAANPRFEQHPCTIRNADATLASRMHCGTVRVPRDYARPDGQSFALSVVVIESERKPELPEPVVYINGGPGEPITVYAAAQAKRPYALGRSLVLIDQRGTGASEPRICPAMDRKLLDVSLLVEAEDGASTADARRAFDACRREALSRGIDLANFGTRVTADDFESVRRALKVERWNLYGESYGTDIAMTLAALHPATIRSMILDSIYPPDPRPPRATSVAAARKAFFTLCDGDPNCSRQPDGLEHAYNEARAQLARTPLTLTLPRGSKWPSERFTLTAAAFELVVANLLYYRDAYPTIPLVIMWAKDGVREPLASVAEKIYEAALTREAATTVAVECRDRPQFRDAAPVSGDIVARRELAGLCDTWAPLGPPLLIPAGSTVPTLILAGSIDPVAEPHESRRIAEIIGGNAQWIEFPEVGHNVRAFSPCAARIVAEFIAQPERRLDVNCAIHPAPLRF